MHKTPAKPSKSHLNLITFLGVFNLGVSLVIIFILIFGASLGYRVTVPVTMQETQPIEVSDDTPVSVVEETATPTRTDTPVPVQEATETEAPIEVETLFTPGEPIVIKYETGKSVIRLPDNSEIILGLDTEIELLEIYDLTPQATKHEILLLRGIIYVESKLPDGIWFTVLNPKGQKVRVTGSIMIVDYDADAGLFKTDCVEGDCVFLSPEDQEILHLAAHEHGWLDENGFFDGPIAVNIEELRRVYGEEKIPEKEPDLDATATQACNDFQSEFPGTPCP